MDMYTTLGNVFSVRQLLPRQRFPLRVIQDNRCALFYYTECSTEIAKLDTRLRDMWPSLELIETAAELSDGALIPVPSKLELQGLAVGPLHHPPKVLQVHCGFYSFEVC